MANTYERCDWYENPRYYDLIFDEDTALEGAFLETMLERYGQSGGKRVLEPACGSGRLITEMVERGYDVTGFDASEAMLGFAHERLRKRRLKADVRAGRMEDFRTRARFDLAHCLVSTFKYLLTEEHARAHLECVARSLRKGGLYVLGLHLSEYDVTSKTRERWVVERDGAHVVCNIQSWPPDRKTRLEKVRSRLIVQEGRQTRRMETVWNFRTYDARQLRRLLRSVPALEHVTTFDFTYELGQERALDDEQMDCVLILRRV